MGDYLKPPEQVAETILRYLQELGCEMGPSLAERISMEVFPKPKEKQS